jgi:EAL domain-containing protein (putative c-di-GMP-specific phosphodiesterase class I)
MGLVPPDTFIPLAEEVGLIEGIGRWVLEQAGANANCWWRAVIRHPRRGQPVDAPIAQGDIVAIVRRVFAGQPDRAWPARTRGDGNRDHGS